MADLIGKKKRLSISLSIFAPNDHKSPIKSPKSFQPSGVVGLGIVAALGESDHTHDPFISSRAVISALSPRSNPIPILNSNNSSSGSSSSPAAKVRWPNSNVEGDDNEMELSEEYTCVISHIGDNLIKKREYFDGVLANETQGYTCSSFWGEAAPVEKAAHFEAADYLKCCYLCKKHLRGLDIFMYRGEKAFCSEECRCKQMAMEERKICKEKEEKCGLGGAGAESRVRESTMKTITTTISKSFELPSPASPCSSPMQLFAGFAAA